MMKAVFALFLLLGQVVEADLVISEFLASNDFDLQDNDGDYSDWIEIHNTASTAEDLEGLSLTDDVQDPTKWTFPVVSIPANGYLVVFASSKDRTDPNQQLHTNFSLKAGGEYLGLYAGTDLIYEYSPEYPPQTQDRSYGVDSNSNVRYFSNPTPGSANGVGDEPAAEGVSASVDRGFYESSFPLTLTTAQPNAQIRYTTDGSVPDASSTLYTSPVEISTTTVVRAAAFADMFLPSETTTLSYIFVRDVLQQPAAIPGFPNGKLRPSATNWDSVPLDMEMDPEVVSDYSSEIAGSMTAIPTMTITASVDDIFGNNGFYLSNQSVEKEASIEILYPDDPAINEQINTGVESHSWDRLKRSLRLNFRKDYGKSVWQTGLLQGGPLVGSSATDKHRTLILRAGNNRSWARPWNPDATAYTIDQFYRDTFIAMTGFGSHGTFVHLYLNGVYWGVYNVVERPDNHFGAEYFGGDEDDWFYTNHGGAGSASSSRWNYLKNSLVDKDMRDPANYAEMQEYLNVQSFADYILLAFYMGLTDWPRNNWYVNHRTDTSPDGPTPVEFFAWDGEWSLDRDRYNNIVPEGANIQMIFKVDPDSNWPILKIWHSLLDSPAFRTIFSNRITLHTGPGGALSTNAAIDRWDALNNVIESAIVGESARWGDSLKSLGGKFSVTRTRNVDWQNEVDHIRGLLQNNTDQLIDAVVDAGFYSNIQPPIINPNGGDVSIGSTVTIRSPNGAGSIVYTLDGSSPSDSSTALSYQGPLTITESVVVQAAVDVGGAFSPISMATFRVPTFAVTELHYHPAAPSAEEVAAGFIDANDFEFIELQNVALQKLDLAGLSFTTGITASPPAQNIDPWQVFVLVANIDAFTFRYGTAPMVVGEYTGSLSNGGEQIVLEYPAGVIIADFEYNDNDTWPTSPDGGGASLEVIDLSVSLSEPANWRASDAIGGNPGTVGGATISTRIPTAEPTAEPTPIPQNTPSDGTSGTVGTRIPTPEPTPIPQNTPSDGTSGTVATRIPAPVATLIPLNTPSDGTSGTVGTSFICWCFFFLCFILL